MSELMQTGIEYPTITLGGVAYELRLSRHVLAFRLSKRGLTLADLRSGARQLSALYEVLHAMISDRYLGSVEDLVELVASEEKQRAVDQAVAAVIKKAFPLPVATPAGEPKPLTQ